MSKGPSKVNQNTSIKHKNTIGSIVVKILSINKIQLPMSNFFFRLVFLSIKSAIAQALQIKFNDETIPSF